jgi:chemotaxis protein methyltransferase CheR
MSAAPAFRPRSEPIVEGEYLFTQRNYDQIADFLRETTGIALGDQKVALVYSRLTKRLRKLGIATFDEYCAMVESPEGAAERLEMMAALTTNVTRFFREPHHFEHFRSSVLPGLIRTARSGGRVRLWSAACSSGEEPYSLALTLLQDFPDAARHDVRILASDIDPNIVRRARAGVYSEEAISPVPASLRDRWMTRDQESGARSWAVNDEAKALIAFRELNLIGGWPMRGKFDVILCRNVVIYFEEATQATLWKRFGAILTPGGHLYVGHSERVDVDGFESCGLTVYSTRGGAGR